MARTKKKPTPRSLPVDGRIRGGRLNGWWFHFQRFALVHEALVLIARCTPPAWPFFREINLHEGLFVELEPGSDDKKLQRYVPLETEIEAAYKRAGVEPPTWIWDQEQRLPDMLRRAYEAAP